jgi:hypothetical protein
MKKRICHNSVKNGQINNLFGSYDAEWINLAVLSATRSKNDG